MRNFALITLAILAAIFIPTIVILWIFGIVGGIWLFKTAFGDEEY